MECAALPSPRLVPRREKGDFHDGGGIQARPLAAPARYSMLRFALYDLILTNEEACSGTPQEHHESSRENRSGSSDGRHAVARLPSDDGFLQAYRAAIPDHL